MSVYLHIGYPKTATSWLQRGVFPYHPEINFLGGRQVPSWVGEIVTLHDLDFNPEWFRAQVTDLSKPTLISWESLSGDPWVGSWDVCRNANRIHAIWPDAKIIVCVRSQIEMIESLYRQYIKMGGSGSINHFLTRESERNIEYFSLNSLRYDRVLDYYQNLFGNDSVFSYLYEDLSRDSETFLNRLFDFVGVSGMRPEEYHSDERVNISYANTTIRFASVAHRFIHSRFNPAPIVPERVFNATKLRKILNHHWFDLGIARRLESRQIKLTDEKRASLAEHYRESNRRLRDNFNLPIEEFNYPL